MWRISVVRGVQLLVMCDDLSLQKAWICVATAAALVTNCRDHRNESLRDWLIGEHVLGAANGLGNENVSGMLANRYTPAFCSHALYHFRPSSHS